MENYISLRPHPATISYLTRFQEAQRNLSLFIQDERLSKRKRKQRIFLRPND